jgi:hypothetical protein
MAGGTTQGRESVFAQRRKLKEKSKWIPAFAGMTKGEVFAGMKRKELDPGLRRDDEVEACLPE